MDHLSPELVCLCTAVCRVRSCLVGHLDAIHA